MKSKHKKIEKKYCFWKQVVNLRRNMFICIRFLKELIITYEQCQK